MIFLKFKQIGLIIKGISSITQSIESAFREERFKAKSTTGDFSGISFGDIRCHFSNSYWLGVNGTFGSDAFNIDYCSIDKNSLILAMGPSPSSDDALILSGAVNSTKCLFGYFSAENLKEVENIFLKISNAMDIPAVLFLFYPSQLPPNEPRSFVEINDFDYFDELSQTLIRIRNAVHYKKQICLIIVDDLEFLGEKKSAHFRRIFF